MSLRNDFLKKAIYGGNVVSLTVAIQFVVGFFVQIILARQISPDAFGVVAMAASFGLIFNGLTNTFGDKFLIQSKSEHKKILDNIFTLELMLSAFFFILIASINWIFENKQNSESFSLIVLILAFSYFYNPFYKPRAIFEYNLQFVKAKIPLIFSHVICGLVTISLAYNDFGIWALVFWRVGVLVFECLVIWLISSYSPKITFDLILTKQIVSFGWPLMIASMLLFFNQNVAFYIFKYIELDASQAGYYWLAFQFSLYFLKLRTILESVLFPMFSTMLNKIEKVSHFLIITKVIGMIFLLITVFGIFFAKNIVLILFGDQWVSATLPLQVFFITILVRAINSNLGYFFQSQGITHVPLVTGIIIIILLPPLGYFFTSQYGVVGMSFAVLLVDIISSVIVYQKFVKTYTGKGFLYFIFKPLTLACASFFIVIYIDILNLNLFFVFLIFLIFTLASFFLFFHSDFRKIFHGNK